jgi:hypothetical protein
MARFETGNTFSTSDQVTAAKLNNAVINAKISSDSVDDNTIELSSDALRLKDSTSTITGVTTSKIADSSSKTTGVTFAKMQHISTAKVLGRSSASEGDIEEAFDFKDEDNMSSNSATALASQQSIKAYVDAQDTANQVLRSLFIFQSTSASSISDSSLSTCPLTQSFSDDASMSVSGNIITLTAGTYIVKADANIGMTNDNYVNTVQGAIVNTGSSDSVLIAGKILQSYNDFSILTTHDFSCVGKLTLSGTTTIALKFRTGGSGSAQVGYSSSITGLGTPIHATVFIEKIA